MSTKSKQPFSIPLWCKVTLVLMLGAALCVWFVFESKRQVSEEFLLQELHDATQHSVETFARQLALGLLTRDTDSVATSIQQHIAVWPEITLIQITDDQGDLFREWKRQPLAFGEGILKFEAPVIYGQQRYGTLSMFINQVDSLAAIREHTISNEMRMALTLMALLLVVTVLINYAAMQPLKRVSDQMYELLKDRPGVNTAAMGEDEISRLESGVSALRDKMVPNPGDKD